MPRRHRSPLVAVPQIELLRHPSLRFGPFRGTTNPRGSPVNFTGNLASASKERSHTAASASHHSAAPRASREIGGMNFPESYSGDALTPLRFDQVFRIFAVQIPTEISAES